MKRLDEIESIKDVESLAKALFPGQHCPLFGSTLAIKGITDSLMLTVGTDECGYYTKAMSINSDGFSDRVLSLILNQDDLSFGFKKKLEESIKEILEEYEQRIIFVVTTCVVELIGEDVDTICANLEKKYDVKLLVVHTEHFKYTNHVQGLQRVLTSLVNIIEPNMEKTNSVNLLGYRATSNFSKTELYKKLSSAGFQINLALPSNCTSREIKEISKAKINIVTNDFALPLAKALKEKFDMPYVIFYSFSNPENIKKAYKELQKSLGVKIDIENEYNEVKEKIKNSDFSNLSYIYGNTPFDVWELNSFLADLGLKPLLIQCSSYDDLYISKSLRDFNPLVSKNANIAPLQKMYDELKPTFYFGHENPRTLREKKILLQAFDSLGSYQGFESSSALLDMLNSAKENRIC